MVYTDEERRLYNKGYNRRKYIDDIEKSRTYVKESYHKQKFYTHNIIKNYDKKFEKLYSEIFDCISKNDDLEVIDYFKSKLINILDDLIEMELEITADDNSSCNIPDDISIGSDSSIDLLGIK